MNTLLHAVYDDPRQAERVSQQLKALGIAESALLSVTAAMINSAAGRAHMGSFADSGAHAHDTERDHVGSFADSGSHNHEAARDRVGGFADSASSAPNGALVGDLVGVGLSEPDAQAAAARLSSGATLVLVRVEGEAAARATPILQSAS